MVGDPCKRTNFAISPPAIKLNGKRLKYKVKHNRTFFSAGYVTRKKFVLRHRVQGDKGISSSGIVYSIQGQSCPQVNINALMPNVTQSGKKKLKQVHNDGVQYSIDLNSPYAVTFTHSSCLLYTSPSPRDKRQSRMPSSA